MLRRPIVHRSPRRQLDVSDTAFGIDANASFAIAAGKLSVTFDQAVNVIGVPPYTKNGVNPTAVDVVTPVRFDLSYATPPAAAETVVIPLRDKSVRTSSGGYVAPTTATLAAGG